MQHKPEVHLAFLWRFHQPWFVDPCTGQSALPWARLHAASTYSDLASILARHPEVKTTISVCPCLLDQVYRFLDGAGDTYIDATLKPAADLTPAQQAFILQHFFSAHWDHVVRPIPRYQELLQKRGLDTPKGGWSEATARFSADELLDLQVLVNLVGGGLSVDDDPELSPLLRRGRNFTEEHKGLVLRKQREIIEGLLPSWEALARQGSVSLCCSPYYYPILPLLVDSDSARRPSPGVQLPRRFAHPEDAEVQIQRAIERMQREFGIRPAGLWPPEGAVTPEVLRIAERCGVRHLTTDAQVLFNSLDERGVAPGRRRLYQPYRVGRCALFFCDSRLTRRIVRGYPGWHDPEDAAEDLLDEIRSVGNFSRVEGDRPPLVVLALAAEVLEAFPNRGRDFLDALFSRLSEMEEVRTVTLDEHLRQHPPAISLDYLHSGARNTGSFEMWIGEADKNRAWHLLGEARERLIRAETEENQALEDATEHLLRAEGSDWFRWLGEPYSSAEDATYEVLFRSHLIAMYRELGDIPPANLSRPIHQGETVQPLRQPNAFIHPQLSGLRSTFLQWKEAGFYRAPAGGSIYNERAFLSGLYWGFDSRRLYIRLDPFQTYCDGYSPVLTGLDIRILLTESRRRFTARLQLTSTMQLQVSVEQDGEPTQDLGAVGEVAFEEVIELALPLSRMGLTSGARLGLSIHFSRGGEELSVIPLQGVIEVEIPPSGEVA